MKKILLTTLAASTLWVSQIATSQAQVLVRPRVGVGFIDYSLDAPQSGGTAVNKTTASGTLVGAGLTIALESFYIDVAASTTVSGEHDGYYDVGFEFASPGSEFERQDFIVTLGTSISETSSAFVGYRSGVTNYNDDDTNYSLEFFADGLFGGINFGFPTESGVFSFGGAVALLTGQLTDNAFDTYSGLFNDYDATADITVGLSGNIGYSFFFNEKMGMSIKAGYQRYSYKGFDQTFVPDLNESIFTGEASLFINF